MASKTEIKIVINKDSVMGLDLYANKDYKSASISAKVADKEYIRVSYEWANDTLPEFVVDMMGFLKANKDDVEKAKEVLKEEYASFIERQKLLEV